MQAFSLGAMFVAVALGQTFQGVTNLDGRAVDVLESATGVHATVLVFLRTDCPIANQAAPEIERVRAASDGRGLRMWLVYVDPAQATAEIRHHQREYGLLSPAVRDSSHQLVRHAGVSVTPSAAVYVHESGEPRLVYRGRLDDRVVALGRVRPNATRFDLRDAIEAALTERTADVVTTPAIGCEIADLR